MLARNDEIENLLGLHHHAGYNFTIALDHQYSPCTALPSDPSLAAVVVKFPPQRNFVSRGPAELKKGRTVCSAGDSYHARGSHRRHPEIWVLAPLSPYWSFLGSSFHTDSLQRFCRVFDDGTRVKFAGSTGPQPRNLELTFCVDRHRVERGLSPMLGISYRD